MKIINLIVIISVISRLVTSSQNPGYNTNPHYQQNPNDLYNQRRQSNQPPNQSNQPPNQSGNQPPNQQQYPPQYPPQYSQYPSQYNPQNDRGQYTQQSQGYGPPPTSLVPFGRGQQQQQQEGGFFSKIKSGILAAGAALTGQDQPESNIYNDPQRQQYPPRRPVNNNPYGGSKPPPGYPPSNYNPPSQYNRPPPPQSNQPSDEGFLGKIKNLFSSDEQPSRPIDRRLSPPGYQPGQQTRPVVPNNYPPPPSQAYTPPQQPPHGYGAPPPPVDSYTNPYVDRRQQIPPNYPDYQNKPSNQIPGQSSHIPGPGLSIPPPPSQTSPQYSNYPNPNEQFDTSNSPYPYATTQTNPPIDINSLISPEPQIFVVDDCIVLIAKPREFYRKKSLITAAGPSSLQVFSDFEHVLTKFRTEEGQRALGTAEILESPSQTTNALPILSPQVLSRLQSINDEFSRRLDELDDESFESFTSQCQSAIASDGSLYLSSIPQLIRDTVRQIPLREGWKEAINSLASYSVPFYVFSSGYGDLVVQSLIQAGLTTESRQQLSHLPSPSLPQNLRVISNFFRSAPDGSVRAFSTPVVHERNKNATTASRHMAMPLPERPYALIFGSHEDDISMTDGLSGLKEQLTVGYLEMTEDLPQRISTFLGLYDAVVIGDSSFQYIKTLVDDILSIPPVDNKKNNKLSSHRPSFFDRALGGGIPGLESLNL